ncbi:hypothetical protein T03_3523 [Trichinella britovi]|uniref:Uncharacterized protein n=1 Tax=Trichinella britovi TaxID=45882 RepID=A0A0V1CHA1_TRIBR|nr:hypothetical protein T03_3523 [Trichinella britovi]
MNKKKKYVNKLMQDNNRMLKKMFEQSITVSKRLSARFGANMLTDLSEDRMFSKYPAIPYIHMLKYNNTSSFRFSLCRGAVHCRWWQAMVHFRQPATLSDGRSNPNSNNPTGTFSLMKDSICYSQH